MSRPLGSPPDDFLVSRALRAVAGHETAGRMPSFIWAKVVENVDPEKQGRIKCQFYWQQEDDAAPMETDWITRLVPYNGPTKMARGRKFGINHPFPEIGSRVVLACMGGDVHDLIFMGQPEYLEDETGAPPTDKDDHIDWSFRMVLPNGWEWGVDTEGNEYKVTPGNYRHKILGGGFISARGVLTVFGTMFRAFALGMNRLIGAKVETSNYKTPEEAAMIRDMAIDALSAPPGRPDPGIGDIEDEQ